jgi:hypothetical protein
MPWIGAVIAAATVVGTMRRKGVIGGTFDTGLNAIPLVGALKSGLEVVRGRDFFPDRPATSVSRSRPDLQVGRAQVGRV